MLRRLKQLDLILRGEATRLPALRQGVIDISARDLALVLLVLGMLYGLCMGLFSLINSGGANYKQILATTAKVPLLFFLTLLVTFPSLYVFNALVGSRLSIRSVLRLLVAALGVMLAVLASFGTIVAFFSVSTTSYPFMTLLNVVVFAAAGLLGLSFLLQTLHRLTIVQEEPLAIAPPPQVSVAAESPADSSPAQEPAPPAQELSPPPLPSVRTEPLPPSVVLGPLGALDQTEGRVLGQHVRTVFKIWIIVFGLVGAQMGWVLRPFIGSPNMEFSFFRPRSSNIFQAIWGALRSLLGA